MRHLAPVLVAAFALLSTANADPVKPAPFSNKSFGDGGGYKHPDSDVGRYFETHPQDSADSEPQDSAKPKPERPQAPAKVAPEIKPTVAEPSRPRPRPFAASAPAVSPAAGTDARPAAATVGKAPAEAPSSGTDDSASEDARRDYEKRLFGASPSPRRPELEDRKPAPSADPAPAAPIALIPPMGEGMLFVSLELDPQEAGTLRDAVAGLGASAAFRPDARFQPIPGAGRSVRISGWLPASKLAEAIARPGVTRVEVERGSRPAPDSRVTGDYLLTLRVTDPARPEESIAASVGELSAATGFKLDRVVGFETAAGGASTALVSGVMPVSRLSRALGLPGVIKVVSASPAETVPSAPSPAKRQGFVKFVMTRGLWLVLLTMLLILPTVSSAVRRGLSVFVPYR